MRRITDGVIKALRSTPPLFAIFDMPEMGDDDPSGRWRVRPVEEDEMTHESPDPGILGTGHTGPVPERPTQQTPTEQFVLHIGDIGISPSWIVTPNGTAPLAGSKWIARDMSRTEKKIPTWAIVLAIVFALFCLVGLFFLLVKEEQTGGYFEVSVMSGNLQHMTQIPINSQQQIAQVRRDVSYAQTLAAQATPV
jgi:hypothetical protein